MLLLVRYFAIISIFLYVLRSCIKRKNKISIRRVVQYPISSESISSDMRKFVTKRSLSVVIITDIHDLPLQQACKYLCIKGHPNRGQKGSPRQNNAHKSSD